MWIYSVIDEWTTKNELLLDFGWNRFILSIQSTWKTLSLLVLIDLRQVVHYFVKVIFSYLPIVFQGMTLRPFQWDVVHTAIFLLPANHPTFDQFHVVSHFCPLQNRIVKNWKCNNKLILNNCFIFNKSMYPAISSIRLCFSYFPRSS